MTPESALMNEIIRSVYGVARLFRINTGTVTTDKGYRFSTGTPKGYSDLSGHIRAGASRFGIAVPVYIEAKVKPNKPTPEQIDFIRDRREEGCAAGVCYSVREVWELLAPYLRTEADAGGAGDEDW